LLATVDYTMNASGATQVSVELLSNLGECATIDAVLKVNGQSVPQTFPGNTKSHHLLITSCTPAAWRGSLGTAATGDLQLTLSDSSDTLTLTQPAGFQAFALVGAQPFHVGDSFVITVPQFVHDSFDATFLGDVNGVTQSAPLMAAQDGFHGAVPSIKAGAYHVRVNTPFSYNIQSCDGFVTCEAKPDVVADYPVTVQ
jgi:hypothetical protein